MDSLANELVRRLGNPIEAGRNELRWCCPYCFRKKGREDTKFHLYVNTTKKKFFCQRCATGGVISYLFRTLGIKVTEEETVRGWSDMIRSLRAISGVDYTEDYDPDEPTEYPCDVRPVRKGSFAYKYLTRSKKRKLDGLPCRGLSREDVKKYGFCVGIGWWSDRLFIPSEGINGMTFWTARDLSGEHDIKYLHPRDRQRRFHVFNLDKAKEYEDVVITEGPFDAIAAGPNGVAIYGSYGSLSQLKMIKACKFRTHYVALDPDITPLAAKLGEALNSIGCRVKLVKLPDGEDPASVKDFGSYLERAKTYSFGADLKFRLDSVR